MDLILKVILVKMFSVTSLEAVKPTNRTTVGAEIIVDESPEYLKRIIIVYNIVVQIIHGH